jgi:hypothetical protein
LIAALWVSESFYDKEKFATFDADDTEATTFYPTGKDQSPNL